VSTLSLASKPGLLGIPTDRATSESGVRRSRDIEGSLGSDQAGWDGYGAEVLHPGALELARRLVLALPKGYEVPLVAAHPDGEVALTWIPYQTLINLYLRAAPRRSAS
jgi:hypothetical protein